MTPLQQYIIESSDALEQFKKNILAIMPKRFDPREWCMYWASLSASRNKFFIYMDTGAIENNRMFFEATKFLFTAAKYFPFVYQDKELRAVKNERKKDYWDKLFTPWSRIIERGSLSGLIDPAPGSMRNALFHQLRWPIDFADLALTESEKYCDDIEAEFDKLAQSIGMKRADIVRVRRTRFTF